MNSLADQIGAVVNSVDTVVKPPVLASHLCCQACGAASTYDPSTPMPTGCSCGGKLWIGETAEQAKQRATMAASASKPKVRRASAPKAAPAQPAAPVDPAVTVDASTPKEKQQAAQAALIERLELNHTEYKCAGSGVVDAVGYTVWTDQKPEYVIQAPIETTLDFMRQYREDRKTHPAVRFDAAQIQELNEELRPCVFRNQLIASLVFPGGILRVKAGQRVKIGAKISGTGSVVWAVLP